MSKEVKRIIEGLKKVQRDGTNKIDPTILIWVKKAISMLADLAEEGEADERDFIECDSQETSTDGDYEPSEREETDDLASEAVDSDEETQPPPSKAPKADPGCPITTTDGAERKRSS
jgi:hypothetical protein